MNEHPASGIRCFFVMNLRNDQLLRGIHASKQRIPVYNLPRPELYIASLVILSQILFQPKTQQKTGTLYFVSIMYDIPLVSGIIHHITL
jgi:hypothetical protein